MWLINMDTLQQYFLQEQPQPNWRGGCTAPTVLRRARFNLPLWTSGERSFRVDFVTIVTHNVKYTWWYIVFVLIFHSFIHSDNNFSQTFAYLAFLYIWTNLTTVEVIKNLLYLKHVSFSWFTTYFLDTLNLAWFNHKPTLILTIWYDPFTGWVSEMVSKKYIQYVKQIAFGWFTSK